LVFTGFPAFKHVEQLVAKEVFRMLDAFADRASEYCKLFICDGEACNSILKSAICGQLSPELKRKMFQTKFFSRLRHVPIQGLEELPHFPIRSCFLDDGDPIFCMPGSAHAVKNAAGQVCSETKVPYFGRHFCDATGALEFSLPIPAYVRKDGMSDRLSSLLANPFFLMRLRDNWICKLFQMMSNYLLMSFGALIIMGSDRTSHMS
jgi:hypothetical protein